MAPESIPVRLADGMRSQDYVRDKLTL